MLTEMGMRKVTGSIVKLGQKNDPEVNLILQAAVNELHKLKESRFPRG